MSLARYMVAVVGDGLAYISWLKVTVQRNDRIAAIKPLGQISKYINAKIINSAQFVPLWILSLLLDYLLRNIHKPNYLLLMY